MITRYVWVYPLKQKDEVFDRFLQWKAQVEKSSGRKFSDYAKGFDQPEIETNTENTAPRRSERQRKPPEFYGIRVNMCSEKPREPVTIEEAIACTEKAEWMQAMETEMKSLKEN